MRRMMTTTSNTKTHKVAVSEVIRDHMSSRISRTRTANELLGETVHAADSLLKRFLKENHPDWELYLRQTAQGSQNGAPGMLISIDNAISASECECCPTGKKYEVSFASPLLDNWENRTRCVWVKSIEVREDTDNHTLTVRSKLRIILQDDHFTTSVVYDDLPHTTVRLRQGFVGGTDLINGTSATAVRPLKADTEQEKVAMESLRETLTEGEWHRYLKRGFVVVRGSSGREYQIFRDRWHTKVRDKGKVVAEVCARISGRVPATDNVIAFKAMIEADEKQFEKVGNVYKMAAA